MIGSAMRLSKMAAVVRQAASRKAGLATSSTRCSASSWAGGAVPGGARTRAGSDLRAQVEIDLPDAFTGTKVDLRVPSRIACDACNGTGSANKQAERDTCTTCGGSGKVRAQQGFFLVERSCPTCGGMGRMVRNPCRVCAVSARCRVSGRCRSPFPAGVEDGVPDPVAGRG